MNEENAILYFWNSSCSVCEPLYEKLEILISNHFPKINIHKINISNYPEYRAKYNVFTSPLIIFMLDGQEYFRSGANVGVAELKQKIKRLYDLKFEE